MPLMRRYESVLFKTESWGEFRSKKSLHIERTACWTHHHGAADYAAYFVLDLDLLVLKAKHRDSRAVRFDVTEVAQMPRFELGCSMIDVVWIEVACGRMWSVRLKKFVPE